MCVAEGDIKCERGNERITRNRKIKDKKGGNNMEKD